jgi:uncharacterized protein YcbK (DUF882 family)
MKHFTLAELTHSTTAAAQNIDNTPPPAVVAKLVALTNKLLDPVRELWGDPLTVNSGFRSPALNKAIGGAVASQHMKGEAADITAGTPEKNKALFNMILAASIEFDQMIDEKGYTWIHLSYRAGANRRQLLHLL